VASGRPKRMLSATVALLLPKLENRNPSNGTVAGPDRIKRLR